MKFAREVPSEKWCREALLLADDPLLDPDKRDRTGADGNSRLPNANGSMIFTATFCQPPDN